MQARVEVAVKECAVPGVFIVWDWPTSSAVQMHRDFPLTLYIHVSLLVHCTEPQIHIREM